MRESGTVVPLLTIAASAPWHPGAGLLHTNSFQDSEIWRLLTTADVGNVTHGQGVPDHQVLPIGGAQHVNAFCQLFQGSTACAVCSGCFSNQGPASGPRQCWAVAVRPTKTLRWGLGIALRRVCGWGWEGSVKAGCQTEHRGRIPCGALHAESWPSSVLWQRDVNRPTCTLFALPACILWTIQHIALTLQPLTPRQNSPTVDMDEDDCFAPIFKLQSHIVRHCKHCGYCQPPSSFSSPSCHPQPLSCPSLRQSSHWHNQHLIVNTTTTERHVESRTLLQELHRGDLWGNPQRIPNGPQKFRHFVGVHVQRPGGIGHVGKESCAREVRPPLPGAAYIEETYIVLCGTSQPSSRH